MKLSKQITGTIGIAAVFCMLAAPGIVVAGNGSASSDSIAGIGFTLDNAFLLAGNGNGSGGGGGGAGGSGGGDGDCDGSGNDGETGGNGHGPGDGTETGDCINS